MSTRLRKTREMPERLSGDGVLRTLCPRRQTFTVEHNTKGTWCIKCGPGSAQIGQDDPPVSLGAGWSEDFITDGDLKCQRLRQT